MKILADQKILLAEKYFSSLGEVILQAGSEISPLSVKDIDALVVRTTTKVDKNLLQDSSVRFVATATSGTDHVDLEYLKQNNIGFGSSAGCNADAVAEFVLNALIRHLKGKKIKLKDQILGIIGVGNAGSALERKAQKLGIRCLLNDPPRAETFNDKPYIGLSELLEQATVVSLHVPLTRSAPHPTFHLLNVNTLEKVQKGTIIINTSRGGIIQESALLNIQNRLNGIILDVWENEPNIQQETLLRADIATPHIAGYSYEAKVKATAFAYHNICSYFGKAPASFETNKPATMLPELSPERGDFICSLITAAYDIFADDRALRKIGTQGLDHRYFRSLRNQYQFRREFSAYKIANPSLYQSSEVEIAANLGFQI